MKKNIFELYPKTSIISCFFILIFLVEVVSSGILLVYGKTPYVDKDVDIPTKTLSGFRVFKWNGKVEHNSLYGKKKTKIDENGFISSHPVKKIKNPEVVRIFVVGGDCVLP